MKDDKERNYFSIRTMFWKRLLLKAPHYFIYLFTSIFIQVKIRFNKCTISNTVTNTAINAFPVVKYQVD